jgi:WD40 repeat protein
VLGQPAPRQPAPPPAREKPAPTEVAPSPAPLATVARFQPSSFRDQGVLAEGVPLQVVAVSPDERLLAAGGVDGSIRMWDLARRVGLRTLRSRTHLKTGYAALTTCIAFSPDGRLLAAGHLDGTIDLFDPESGFELEVRLRHEGAVGGLGFTPDGMTLVSGGQDAAMKYWEVAAAAGGEGRRELRRQPAEVTVLAVSPRGDLVVTGHGNRNLRVHDASSGRLVATFHGLRAVPSALAVSPDGGIVACGSRDGVIRLFRTANRALLRSFEGHSKTVSSLVFFPDGRHLASVAMDPEVAVWEVSQDDRLATLSVAGGAAAAGLAMMGRSGQLLCGSSGGQIRVWSFA